VEAYESGTLNVRVPRWILDALDEIGADADLNRSEIVRTVLEDEFAGFKPAPVYVLPLSQNGGADAA